MNIETFYEYAKNMPDGLDKYRSGLGEINYEILTSNTSKILAHFFFNLSILDLTKKVTKGGDLQPEYYKRKTVVEAGIKTNGKITSVKVTDFLIKLFLSVGLGAATIKYYIDGDSTLTILLGFLFVYHTITLILNIKQMFMRKKKIKLYISFEDILRELRNHSLKTSFFPERKLCELVRRHPWMFNEEDIFKVYTVAKFNLNFQEIAEGAVSENSI